MARRHIIGLVGVASLVAVGVGGWYYGYAARSGSPTEWRDRMAYEDVLPEFAEPGAGPRPPTYDAFGLRPGRDTLADVKRWIGDRSLACTDTSVRALMANYRDKKAAEIEQAKAEGHADGASGASWLNRQTKHEKNPQVRLTCERVRLSLIGDRDRSEEVIGRLLFVFDSADLPLRHITIQRRYPNDGHGPARAAFIESDAAMRALLGEPTISRNDPPPEGGEFTRMQSLRREWKFADFEAKVAALSLGSGITVWEEVGVPWPVRPDAPTLAAK